MSASQIKASDIRAAMAKRWMAPEYAIMWEVADATGGSARRRADAVIMSLWPSRGLELHGVEIKVSRSDWRREAADPAKAEAIAQYCDRWWIHTAPGVVDDVSDLPPAWGLREWNGKRWTTRREAEKTEALSPSRAFLAALLRRADGLMKEFIAEANRTATEQLLAEGAKRREQFNEAVERSVANKMRHLEQDSKDLKAFREAFGDRHYVGLDGWTRIGKAAALLADCKTDAYGCLAQRLRAAAAEIEKIDRLELDDVVAAE